MRTKKLRVFASEAPAGHMRFSWDHNNPPALRVEWNTWEGTCVERLFLSANLRMAAQTLLLIGEPGVSTIMFRGTAFGCLDLGFWNYVTHLYHWVTLREAEVMYLHGFLNQVEDNMAVRNQLIAADLDWHLKNILASS